MSARVKTILGFGLPCLMVFIAMLTSNLTTSGFIETSRWMIHEWEVRTQVEKISTQFMVAQNNIRAYHVTEQDYYLQLYNRAKAELTGSQERLEVLTAANPAQRAHVDKIGALIQVKIDAWENSFELRRQGGFAEILRRMKGDTGKNQDMQLFAALDLLKADEDRMLAERTSKAQLQGQDAKTLILGGGILACLLITGAAFMVYRDSRRRELAEADIDRFFTLSLDLLCIAGMDGHFKRLSPSFEDVLGYSLDEMYERPILDFIHPDDIKRTSAEIASQAQGNKVLSFENRYRTRSGTYRTFSWKSVPVDGMMYAVARDVTLQKQFEADLVLARTEAQKAAVVKSEFLANMSHEIRTPLNGVVGMTDLLARTELQIEQKSFVSGIRSSAMALLKIVNEILDFSKIEAGRMHLDKADFDLAQMIEQQISLVGIAASEKNLLLESVVDPALPRVLRGDSGKIGQVLLNFLNNAVKFTEKGRVEVKVDVLSRESSRCQIRVAVQDSGIGMNREQVARLFEPFVQADGSTARKYGGTGLGLSICKRFVEMMDGKIGVESQPDHGSKFWFDLCLEVSALTAIAASPVESAPSTPAPTAEQIEKRKAIRILVAEDNQINQAIVMNMIATLGYVPTLAKNGEEAVNLFRTSRFDMVLMDQHMPVMGGLEASAEIRRFEKSTGRRTPIIAFTATVIQEDQKPEFKKLMDDIILKPVTMGNLETALATWERRLAAGKV